MPKKKLTTGQVDSDVQHAKEIVFVAVLIVSLFLLVALITYSPMDNGFSIYKSNDMVHNAVGRPGAWFADTSLSLLGIVAYCLPFLFIFFVWHFFQQRSDTNSESIGTFGLRLIGLVLLIVSVCGLAFLFFHNAFVLPQGVGGILGNFLGSATIEVLHVVGATLLFWLLFFVGSTLFANVSWLLVADYLGDLVLGLLSILLVFLSFSKKWVHNLAIKLEKKGSQIKTARARKEQSNRDALLIEPKVVTVIASERQAKESQPSLFEDIDLPKPSLSKPKKSAVEKNIQVSSYGGSTSLPTLSLLSPAVQTTESYSSEALQAMSRQVELKLKDFKVDVEVVAVQPGPVVTRFELMPAPGLKASKITGLSMDLARSLSQTSVRVVEVIPGKSVIGLEVPNENREMVFLSEIIGSQEYEKLKSPLAFALGKDIAGNPIVADLAKMPHVLVAGTTGSGKSVCVNTMVLSLLYKATPDDVRMIMIDPKMLELSVYEDIPHLLSPVVTDMADAANALRWSVAEMERRYKLMSAVGVRNLAGYNKKIALAIASGKPLMDPTLPEGAEPVPLEKLPYIVILIDEFADMIMVVGKKVEELIVRLAQKARAAGIHLVLATQRPSVDVITGLIKSNIPTRMSFQVSSKMDSRVVLDQTGAENLLGKGDMLFLPPGQAFPERVHGAFVDDDEVHAVVGYLKERYATNYIDGLLDSYDESNDSTLIPGSKPVAGTGGDGEQDALYDEAVQIVIETRKASVSGVQRRLRIGYNRAARLVETMEAAGIVSSVGRNGQREVISQSLDSDF